MKRKIAILFMSVIAALFFALCFAGCGGENNPATTPSNHTHSYSNLWSSDEVNHWHAATCGHTDKKDEAPHTYVNGVCTTCDHAHINHVYGNWVEDTPASETTTGSHHKDCFCGNRVTEETPKIVAFEFEWRENGYAVTAYTGSLTKLTVPNEYEGKPVTIIAENAFYGGSFTSITLPDSITSIGNRAFRECYRLTSITIGSGVISIGNYAFAHCESLESITIPASVTSIGIEAFNNCTSLTGVYITDTAAWCNIDFGNYEANPLYYAHKLYFNNNLVTEITADMLQGVTEIKDYAFYGYPSIKIVTIPDNVISIDNSAFEGCTSIIKATMPTLAISYIPKTNLQTVILTSGDSIGDEAFYKCTSLISIEIPDSVTSIGKDAFNNCTILKSIEIPDSVISIGSEAFYKCTNLKSITIPDSVTSIGNRTFTYCESLESITIPNNAISIGDAAFGYCKNLTSITIPNDVISIGDAAFGYCEKLTSVTIGGKVTSIGDYAFLSCINLTGVYITDIAAWCNIEFGSYDANPLYYAHNLYLNDNLIAEITANMLQGVTEIKDYVFYYCTSLTSITIPASVTSIGEKAFRACTSLTSATFEYRLWKVSMDSDMSNASNVVLGTPAQNASYLKDTYNYYYWKKLI